MDTITWLKHCIRDHLDWVKAVEASTHDGRTLTQDEFLSLWLTWMGKNEFVKIFGRREGYILLHPVCLDWLFEPGINYYENLFRTDPSGDVTFIDSLWAPGRYPQVIEVLRATRRTYAAWIHPASLFLCRIDSLSPDRLIKSQIKRALIAV